MSVPNLDGMTESELNALWGKYHHGRRNDSKELIGDTRPGFTNIARDLANYAINKSAAISLRARGELSRAEVYETICERIYKRLPADLRW